MRALLLRTTLPVLLGLAVLACGGTSATQPSPPPSQQTQNPPDAATARLPLAEVDSLHVPARIATTDTLVVHLTGTVGPNGCYALARIETERTNGQVILHPLVQPPRDDDQMCTMALVPLDETHRIAPPFEPGTLTVSVPQQEGPAVTATVEITDDP